MRKQEGSILVMTLVTVAVLMIIGTTYAATTTMDYSSTENNNKTVKSFYVAEAGLAYGMQYLQENVATLKHATSAVVIPNYAIADIGQVQLTIIPQGNPIDRLWRLESTANHVGSQQLVSALFQMPPVQGVSEEDLSQGFFAAKEISLSNHAKITGTVVTNATSNGAITISSHAQIDGDVFVGPTSGSTVVSNANRVTGSIEALPTERAFTMPIFPPFPGGLPARGSLSVTGTQTIINDGYYTNLSVQGNLVVTVGDADRIIRADTFTLGNHAKLTINKTGTGQLKLYVSNSFSLQNHAKLNAEGQAADVFIYYQGLPSLTTANHTMLVGTVFAKTANVSFSNHSDFAGHIITGGSAVTLSNHATANVRVLYAPNAVVTVENHGLFAGNIISSRIQAQNHSDLIFNTSGVPSFMSILGGLGMAGGDDTVTFHSWQNR